MKLLELPSGMVSLEYAMVEQAEVRSRLDAIADVRVVDRLTYVILSVGGEPLINMTDWDEPCLIAQSEAGNAILRHVCRTNVVGTSIAAE